jgi:two-component system LytT family sensor kinase
METKALTDVDIPNSTRTRSGAFPRVSAMPDPLARTGEYSIFGLTRTADEAVVRERKVSFTLGLFGVATVIAVLYSLERYFYSRLIGEPVALSQLVPRELLFTYAWALLAPLVMYVARRYPVWSERGFRNWAIQATAMVTFVVVHIALFTLASMALSPTTSVSDIVDTFGRFLLTWTVLDASVFCTLVAVHHAVVYYQVSRDRAIRASQLETRLAQSQLQMLRMQLQPHFLFNTLHSISALMHKDVRRADSMIVSLSDLLRMSLQNIGAQEVALQSELEFLQRYLEIMTLRFGDRLAVVMDIEEDVRDARVPNLFLQPLVENSFRHGFGDVGAGSIRISVRREGEMLRCDVSDDGRGLRSGHKEGVGLTSTRQRLEHLYGDRQSFTLQGAPGKGVRVSMAIPFHPYERTAAD